MEQRLKSVFQDPRLALALKAVLVLGALFWLITSNFSFSALIGSAILIWYVLKRGEISGAPYNVATITLIASSLWLSYVFPDAKALILLVCVSALYIVLCLKKFLLVRRKEWNYIVRLAVSYLVFLGALIIAPGAQFLLILICTYFIFFFLWREYFLGIADETAISWSDTHGAHTKGASALLALIAIESLWVSKLLPFGILQSANISFLATFVTSFLIAGHLSKNLTVKKLLLGICFFAATLLVVFASSRWSL